MFRTAAAAGVSEVWLTGYTSAPIDRHGRERADIAKTALGAQNAVSWTHTNAVRTAVRSLRRRGLCIAGVEQDEQAVPLPRWRNTCPSDVCYVFGNEVRGLSPKLRDQCDVLIEIPHTSRKESLNVSVAAGVILFCGA
jgi:tRNA G18 (ribose-2'-O)-methylase SpoU